VRAVTPVAESDKVWMKLVSVKEETEIGLVVKQDENAVNNFGKIVAVGPGEMMDNGESEPHNLKVDDVVMFEEHTGREIKLQGDSFTVCRIKNVVATLNL